MAKKFHYKLKRGEHFSPEMGVYNSSIRDSFSRNSATLLPRNCSAFSKQVFLAEQLRMIWLKYHNLLIDTRYLTPKDMVVISKAFY